MRGWTRRFLPGPSSCHFSLGSWFVMRGYREERAALACPTAVLAPEEISVHQRAGIGNAYSHLELPLLDIAPDTKDWSCILVKKYLRIQIWERRGVPFQGTCKTHSESNLMVCGALCREKFPLTHFSYFGVKRDFHSPKMHYLICWPKMCIK